MTTATELTAKKCTPCEGGVPALKSHEVSRLQAAVPQWRLTADGKRIVRTWRVKDFAAGLEFFRRVGDLAEAEGHHPDLHLTGYRDVAIELWTHAAGGLTENDFILAAKIDGLPQPPLKA
ncbi:MAG TPA: 4a-hydroxytetrahydrobiopterin dehydratase [Fimbriiglobus sp.]|nr:4a-hydroxytetrahydrobiopterin dehydratase [Fimbriiglobus sp.]